MNALILANNAPNYFNFFSAFEKVCDMEYNCIYACDSEYSIDYNRLKNRHRIYCFEKFFDSKLVNCEIESANEIDNEIRNEFKLWLLNPDFDRNYYYSTFSKKISNDFDELHYQLVLFFYNIMKNNDIKFIIYENPSNLFALIAREVGKRLGIPYFGITISRLPGRISILTDWEKESEIYSNIFNELLSGNKKIDKELELEIIDYKDKFLSLTPDYMKNNPLNSVSTIEKYFTLDKINIFLNKLKFLFSSSKNRFQVGNPTIVSLRSFNRNLLRSIKIYIIKSLFKKIKERPVDEKYILYPLHYHPEASTSLLAREYHSEYEVIKNVAFSLPKGVKLYVKDHISAYGYPSIKFYNMLSELPNVVLINPYENTKEIIKGSELVVTLTSTVGFEALILNKPVITFGSVFYNFHKLCFQCDSYKKIPQYLDRIIYNKYSSDDEYNDLFISSYFLGTYRVLIDYKSENEEQQLNSANELFHLIKSRLNAK